MEVDPTTLVWRLQHDLASTLSTLAADGSVQPILILMARFYQRKRGIAWQFQAIDSKSCPAPLGGDASGASPVDRGKRGSAAHSG